MANEDWAASVLAAVTKLAQSPSLTWEQASSYALLPDATTCAGSTWLVLQGTGIWPTSKPAGWYYSDGASWSYLGSYNPIVSGGNVVVTNFPSNYPVTGPLTDVQLRAAPIPVSGNFSLAGSVTVGNFPAVQPVNDNGASLTVDGTVAISNFPATQPVSGTFWQATQPVSGPLTDTQLRASALPVSGTFYQATQPVSVASLPLPSGASTEATLALIKAKTDNLDVLLSTRTKPADSQTISGSVSVSNFPATQPVSGTFWQVTQPVSGPLTDAQLRASAVPISGTFWQATQPVSGTVTITPPSLAKGTQGSTGLSVQDLKDASRTYVSFTANAIAGVTTEALVSFAQNKQGANTASVTSYTVTSGKTLRITSISVSVKSAAAAIAFTKIILRHNTAGATTTASPIAYLCPEINTNSATSGTSAFITIPIPDGLEFFGNGTQTIGVSHLDQATTNVLNITVYGFEY